MFSLIAQKYFGDNKHIYVRISYDDILNSFMIQIFYQGNTKVFTLLNKKYNALEIINASILHYKFESYISNKYRISKYPVNINEIQPVATITYSPIESESSNISDIISSWLYNSMFGDQDLRQKLKTQKKLNKNILKMINPKKQKKRKSIKISDICDDPTKINLETSPNHSEEYLNQKYKDVLKTKGYECDDIDSISTWEKSIIVGSYTPSHPSINNKKPKSK